jgi:hypothetical protein
VATPRTTGTLQRLRQEGQSVNGLRAPGLVPRAPAAHGHLRLPKAVTGSTGGRRAPNAKHAGGYAIIPVAKGRPLKIPEPTYRFHGVRVPVGACGAVIDGHVQVLPCNASAARAYRVRAIRQAREVRLAGDAGAGLLAVAAGWLAVTGARRSHRRMGKGG